jgi:hypothetical protein
MSRFAGFLPMGLKLFALGKHAPAVPGITVTVIYSWLR